MRSRIDRLMQFSKFLFACVVSCVASHSGLRAQLTPLPASGCSESSSVGTDVFAVDDQVPQLGNFGFALEHLCEVGSNAAFFVFGVCATGSPVDWNLNDPCFGAWATMPSSCVNVVDDLTASLDGSLTRQGGKVIVPFPIPNIPALVTFTQSTPLCFQFICVDLNAANPCRSVSRGVSMTILP